MVIGGRGLGARAAVSRAASQLDIELIVDGPLALAAPPGSIQEGQVGDTRLWLSGRVDTDDLDTGLRGAHLTPVLAAAAAFDKIGEAARAQLHGAFLLVVLDRAGKTVRLSHDHLGARTLNYVRCGPDTYFAEHIADLLRLLQSTPTPDRLALVQWIDRRTLPLERSLYTGIERLGSGETLELAENRVAVRRFWQPTYRDPPQISERDSAAVVATAAYAAVARAAAELERPGVKLSGGLDSACVAAGLAARCAERRPLALSSTFPNYPEADEGDLLEQTARATGIPLVKLRYADAPIVPAALEYIQRWRVPPGSPNAPVWEPLMLEARSRGVDGLLDGEGGDELFGVPPYLIADRLARGRLRSAWSLSGRLPGMGERPAIAGRLQALRVYGVSGAVPPTVQRWRRSLRETRAGVGPLVCDPDVPGLLEQDDTWLWKSADGPLWWRSAVDSFLNDGQRLDAGGEMLRNAIGAGLERRHPFAHDARLVEAMLAIPPEHQFDAVRDRPLLRDGLAGVIPDAVRTRYVKSYFNEVLTRPLCGQEGAAVLAQLQAPTAPVREYVRREGIDELGTIFGAQGMRRHQLAGRLFRLGCVNAWLRSIGGADIAAADAVLSLDLRQPGA